MKTLLTITIAIMLMLPYTTRVQNAPQEALALRPMAAGVKKIFLQKLKFYLYTELLPHLKNNDLYILIKQMHRYFHYPVPKTVERLRERFDIEWDGIPVLNEYSDAMIAFDGYKPIAIWGFSRSIKDKIAWDEGVYTDVDYRGRGVANAIRDVLFDYLQQERIEIFKIDDLTHPSSAAILTDEASQVLQETFIERHPEAVENIVRRQRGKYKGMLLSLNVNLKKYNPIHKFVKITSMLPTVVQVEPMHSKILTGITQSA